MRTIAVNDFAALHGPDLLGYVGVRALSVDGGTSAWQQSGRPLVTGTDPR